MLDGHESKAYEKSIFPGNDENNGQSSNEALNNLSKTAGLNEERRNRDKDKGEEGKEKKVLDDDYELRDKEEIAVSDRLSGGIDGRNGKYMGYGEYFGWFFFLFQELKEKLGGYFLIEKFFG